jgi:O-antigen/teichoic acid export membrane protein
MIQRKQTIFLLLAAVIYAVAIPALTSHSWLIAGILAVPALLSLATIFDYRRRPRQARLCIVTMAVTLLWYVLLAAVGQVPAEALDISVCFPLVALILVLMARKSILADEKLVRAADRLR